MEKTIVTFSNGVKVLNTTPHPLTFLDGKTVVSVPVSGVLVNAKFIETVVKEGLPKLVKTTVQKDPASEKFIAEFKKENPEVLIIGSIVSAQAYPGEIFGMVSAPGYERVAPAEKRMSVEKFTTFA